MKQVSFLQKIYLKVYNPPMQEGKDYAPPTQGIRRYFFLLWTQLGKLVLLNLTFILSCIPIVTIPASITGLNRVLLLLIREGECRVWHHFWMEFRLNFFKKLIIGTLSAIVLFFLIVTGYLYRDINATGLSLIVMTILLVMIVLIFIYLDYIFVLYSLFSMTIKELIKKTALLAVREHLCTIKLLIPFILSVLTYIFIMYLFPVCLVILFCAIQLSKCIIINNVIDRHVVESTAKEE